MELIATTRRIRACEGEAAAQLLLEYLIAENVAAVRERCARLCVDYSLSYPFDEDDQGPFYQCAEFIRTGVLPEA